MHQVRYNTEKEALKKHYLFAINHPSQFHVFKNLAHRLKDEGNKCCFFIQQRGIIERLVKDQGFEYRMLVSPLWRRVLRGRIGIVMRGLVHLIQAEFRLFFYCLNNPVDTLIGSDIAITHVAKFFNRVSIIFTDDDWYFTKGYYHFAFPFATHIIAAETVDLGKWNDKRISYKGTQKISYLHPNIFVPENSVLKKYSLRTGEFSIVRLVAFDALHDSANNMESGLSAEFLKRVIPFLESKGSVIINAEAGDYPSLSHYCISIDPSDMHSLLFNARFLLTDSQSMHVEAGLLGTPSIRTNKWVDSEQKMHVIDYLEQDYGLGASISPSKPEQLEQKIVEMLDDSSRKAWERKRKKFFSENTDLTEFMYWFVTRYPESFHAYVANNEIVDTFISSSL
jgi:predicted glycosyltransferase